MKQICTVIGCRANKNEKTKNNSPYWVAVSNGYGESFDFDLKSYVVGCKVEKIIGDEVVLETSGKYSRLVEK